jgi:hypothetical protein
MGVYIQQSGPTYQLHTNTIGGVPTGTWAGTREELISGVMNLQTKYVTPNSSNVNDVIDKAEYETIVASPQGGANGMFQELLTAAWRAQRGFFGLLIDLLFQGGDSNQLTRGEVETFVDAAVQRGRR